MTLIPDPYSGPTFASRETYFYPLRVAADAATTPQHRVIAIPAPMAFRT